MAANLHRHQKPLIAGVFAAALALGGCELALHEVGQAPSDGCDVWQARCPSTIEFAGAPPLNPAGTDIARQRIVATAENAPYRPCDGIALGCQARVSGDVLWEQYILVLAGDTGGPAGTSASGPSQASPAPPVTAPDAVGGTPAGAAPAGSSGRIIRTEGRRWGDSAPPTYATPPR